jgi:hypothetical protein
MTCPKCRKNVPDAAIRCPGCGLSKPKVRPPETDEMPSRWFSRTSGKSASRKRAPARRKPAAPPSKAKRAAVLLSISILVTMLGAGAFWFVWPLLQQQGPEPEVAASVLDKLRKMPSNQEGLTVDQSVAQQLEKSRRVGNLVAYQGWSVHQAPGDKSKLLVVFAFDERDNTKQRAEWLADSNGSTFTPLTDLAAAVFKP